MPSKPLTACLDANVLVSALAFGGKPELILESLLKRHFIHVTSPFLLEEVRRTLIRKLALPVPWVEDTLHEIESVSTLLIPKETLSVIGYPPDDLVLETAILGDCNVLVTGDKRHLLPLGSFQGLLIESPSNFLKRLI